MESSGVHGEEGGCHVTARTCIARKDWTEQQGSQAAGHREEGRG